jgi:hypothetical protein
MSLHQLLITLHALAGTAALIAGTGAIWRPGALPLYLPALIACILLLAGAIATDWRAISTATRALYLALALLGGYMIWSGVRALLLQRHGMADSGPYLDRLGFTLVALLDAFAVILAMRLGAPTPAIVITAIAVAAAGNRAIMTRKRHLPPATPASSRPHLRAHRSPG